MTSEIETNDHESDRDGGPNPALICAESLTISKEEDGFAFHFKLPAEGLALRSVAVVDGVPEISFDASLKVPTITEEDVATAFRLASEGVRPEFFYIPIPFWHPFFGRQFKQYLPAWLRGTSVGELLSEADWTMKCLHIGARSNEDKSKFWAWEKTSQLEVLATRLDFPDDNPHGSIKMSCEFAKVQKDENEMVFPEEPKMRIVDDSNSQYSKYITEKLPRIAYGDEPLFLKMQELFKLILAAEWLTKKGVKVSRRWMMDQTAKPDPVEKAIEGTTSYQLQDETNRPPEEMIPQPATRVSQPSDMTVPTFEVEQLAKFGTDLPHGNTHFPRWRKWEWPQETCRRYGWHDSGSNEMIMFEEDGTPCQRQQSLKFFFNKKVILDGQQREEKSAWLSLPLPPHIPHPSDSVSELGQQFVKQLQKSYHQDFNDAFGHITMDSQAIGKGGAELKVTDTIQALALPQLEETTIMKVSVNDYNMLYGEMDPNKPIRPEIPGLCEEVIPNVSSWNELFNETVPWPHVWQVPYIGVGEPAESGGVTTRDIPVREETMKSGRPSSESAWVDQYKKRGSQLAVRAQWETNQGKYDIVDIIVQCERRRVAGDASSTVVIKEYLCPQTQPIHTAPELTNSLYFTASNMHMHGNVCACSSTSTINTIPKNTMSALSQW